MPKSSCKIDNHKCCVCSEQVYGIDPNGFIKNKYMSWKNEYSGGAHYMHWNCYLKSGNNCRCKLCDLRLSTYNKK